MSRYMVVHISKRVDDVKERAAELGYTLTDQQRRRLWVNVIYAMQDALEEELTHAIERYGTPVGEGQ